MNTKLLMIASALFLGACGIILTFIPDVVAAHFRLSEYFQVILILQITGALYFAFAMINWTAKAQLLGGIYARPITIGNLTHFTIGGLALIKAYFSSGLIGILYLGIPYILFAVLFTLVMFRTPDQVIKEA